MRKVVLLLDDCKTSAKWFEKNPLQSTCFVQPTVMEDKGDRYCNDVTLNKFFDFQQNKYAQNIIHFFQLGVKINTPLEICKEIRNLAIQTELKEWMRLTQSNN